MKVLFFGYGGIAARALDLLHDRGDEIAAVVTHRDDPSEARWFTTPAEIAQAHGWTTIYSGETPAGALTALAAAQRPDLILSVFYRELLPEAVLQAARLAALNLHPSLLPAYRGRAPINWVLVNGERLTGVTLHHMTRRADAGDIVGQRELAVGARETALTLYRRIESAGTALLAELLPLVAAGAAPRRPQDHARATTFGRRRPEDGCIDWRWPAERIDRLVRAVAPPWPGAFFDAGGTRVFIEEGEPGEPLPASGAVPPGAIRRDADGVLIAAADRWFRVRAARGLNGA